jgi:hypothetical protein
MPQYKEVIQANMTKIHYAHIWKSHNGTIKKTQKNAILITDTFTELAGKSSGVCHVFDDLNVVLFTMSF